jgi:hypothetical protein
MTSRPVLVSLFPTNGAVQIDSRAVMRLSFNEPITSTNLLVTLTGPAGAVAGATALGFNGTVLTFSPGQPLAVNTTYTLRVQGVRDLSGNLMSGLPIVATFSTLDTLGPTVATLHLAADQKPVAGGKYYWRPSSPQMSRALVFVSRLTWMPSARSPIRLSSCQLRCRPPVR